METISIDKKLYSLIQEESHRQNIRIEKYIENILYYAIQNQWKVAQSYQVLTKKELIQIAEESFEESVKDYDEALMNLAK